MQDQTAVPALVDASVLDERLHAERAKAESLSSYGEPTLVAPANSSDVPDTEVPSEAAMHSLNYERVRVQGHRMFFRCLKCRCLLEEINREQEAHDDWHASLSGSAPAPVVVNASTGDGWD